MTIWEPLLERFPAYQFAVLDEDGTLLAEGHTGPLAWDGDDASLPSGIDEALRRVGEPGANTLCAMAAEVAPGARQRGVAAAVLGGMRDDRFRRRGCGI